MNPKSERSRIAGEALGLGLLAFFIQLIYLKQQTHNPLFEVPVAGALSFVELAREILGKGSLSLDAPPSLYPFFLAGIFWLRGEDFAAVRFVQALLAAANCLLMWRLGYAVFSRPIALGVGLATALYGPLLFFGGMLLPPVWAVFFTLAALHALLWAMGADSVGRFLLPGMLLGLAVLSGAHVLLFALVVFLCLRFSRGRVWWGAGAWLILGLVAVLLPIFFRSEWLVEVIKPTFGLAVQNFYLVWQGREFLPDLDLYYGREFSGLLAILMWRGWVGFPFGIVAPLALVGIGFRLRSPERSKEENLLLVFIATVVVEQLLFEFTSGARMVLVPTLLLFAGVGVREWGRASRRHRGMALAALLLLGAGLNLGPMIKTVQLRQHHWLGYAYEYLGMESNAVREYEKAISLGIERMDTYLNLAGIYSAQNDYARAIGVYRKLLQRWPKESEVQLVLGDHYMKAKLAAEASTVYQKLLSEGGDSAVLLLRLAQARLATQDVAGSIEAYRKLLEIQPQNDEVRFQLGLLYGKEGRLQEAQETYQPLLQDTTWVALAGPRLANLLIRTQQEPEAERVLVQTLRALPASAPALALLGKLLFDQGRYGESLLYFERLRPLQAEDFRVYFYLSKLYQELGRKQEAEEAMDLYVRYRRLKHQADIQQRVHEESGLLLKTILGETP